MLRFNHSWLNRLRVGQKIGCGYAIALGISAVGSIIGFTLTDYHQQQAELAAQDALEEVELYNRLQSRTLHLLAAEQEFILLLSQSQQLPADSQRIAAGYAHVFKDYTEFKQIWQTFEQSEGATKDEAENELPGEVERVEHFQETYGRFIETYLEQMGNLLDQNRSIEFKAEALAQIRKQWLDFHTSPVVAQMHQSSEGLAEVIDFSYEEYDLAEQQIGALDFLRLEIVGGSLLFSMLVAIASAILTTRSIAQPIQDLTKTAQKTIEEKNFDLQVPVRTQDEIGSLATSFNHLIYSVKQLLEQQEVDRQELDFYNQTLEQKVVERTEELHEKNTELQKLLEELSRTQRRMIQNEKMSALGQMMAGIAHEINNPVSFIHGNLDHLNQYTQDLLRVLEAYQTHYPQPPQALQVQIDELELDFLVGDLSKLLQSMHIGTNRVREIIISMKNFSRTDESDLKAVNLHEGIDNTLLILRHRLKATSDRREIQVIREYGQLPLIECYAGQLNQVFMNLLANAIDAIEEANQQRTQEESKANLSVLKIRTSMRQEQQVKIEISDNGSGISESICSQLFDPFFTTKPVGKGTGLGLAISYQVVVEKHQGTIYCESTPGEGTTFVIELPVHPKITQQTAQQILQPV